jgi:hypothetical protein
MSKYREAYARGGSFFIGQEILNSSRFPLISSIYRRPPGEIITNWGIVFFDQLVQL